MTPRFILITTAAILLAACDKRSAEADSAKTAELAQQQQAEQAANDKIRQLEERLNAADQQKASDREAELARVREELAQIKKDKEIAEQRIHNLRSELNKPAPPPIAEAPAARQSEEDDGPRNAAIHADLERVVEEDDEREPVYVGRVVPETQRVKNVEAFYEPLDKYGDWIQTDDYGYVFRPEVSRRHDWRPYTDGRWVHTNHGWTWESNEDFGWATYHYGRWTRVERAGWVWVPGREWGPGWVSWRRGKEECGWAPLPAESRSHQSFTATVDRDYDIGPSAYVFIALSNFGARSYAPVIERPERNVNIINKTVNVTNITYNNVTNNTVVYNGGPNYDVVRARSKQPVENVQVNFAPQAPVGDRTKIANVRQGNNFQIAAPPVPVAPIAVPARVAERLGKPKEDKGWDGVNPAQAQRLKQNIVATSTERPNGPRRGAPSVPIPAVAPNPANPAVVAAPVPPARPVAAAADAARTVPAPGTPPPIAPTAGRPAVVERSRPHDSDATKPKAVADVPAKEDAPTEREPVKTPGPAPARPGASPEVQPGADHPTPENAPRRVRELPAPSAAESGRELPKGSAAVRPPPTADRPTPDAAAAAREHAVARQEAIERQQAADRQQAAARQQAIEKQKADRQAAMERQQTDAREKATARQEAMDKQKADRQAAMERQQSEDQAKAGARQQAIEKQKAARQEAMDRQQSADRQQAAARQQAIENQKAARQAAMERQQTADRQQAAARQQAIERQQQQQAAERPPTVERPRPQPPRPQPAAPVVQRAPQAPPPAQPQTVQPPKRGEDDKKKKKENESNADR